MTMHTWLNDTKLRLLLVSTLLATLPVVPKDCWADSKEAIEYNLETKKGASPEEDNGWTASLNLAGPALWGLSGTAEWGSKFALQMRFRSMNVAWFPYYATGADAKFEWGIGAAAGARWYPLGRDPLSGLFVGLNLEYLHVSGTRPYREWRQGYLIPQVEAGYRWMFDKIFFGVGGAYGPMISLFVDEDFWEGTKIQYETQEIGHFAELILELGIKF